VSSGISLDMNPSSNTRVGLLIALGISALAIAVLASNSVDPTPGGSALPGEPAAAAGARLAGDREASEQSPWTYIDPTGRYEVNLPAGWEVLGEEDQVVRLRGPVRLATTPAPVTTVLRIRSGGDDGRIRICSPHCNDVMPRNTYELARLVVETFGRDEVGCGWPYQRPCASRRWTSFAGDRAVIVGHVGGGDHLVLVHHGRPLWLSWNDVLPAGLLASFRFLDGVAEPDFAGEGQLIRSETAGFEMRVPGTWSVDDRGDMIQLDGARTSLTIRVGSVDGRLVTCDRPARPWERCRDEVVTNLDELREAVAVGPPAGCGWCIPGGHGQTATLAGEEAWTISFYGYEYPAHGSETALYVLAIHDHRPYFVRFHTSAEGPQNTTRSVLWNEILETFRFLP
jgi:hypothetical protein